MAPEKRRVACRECRQQKSRCDSEPPGICSRCRRLGLVCVLASNPNARKTKAQLQRELDRLKDDSGGEPMPHSQEISALNIQVQQPIVAVGASATAHVTPGLPFVISPAASNDLPTPRSDIDRCTPKVLDGHEVDAWRIRDCFTIFFQKYLPILPVLDSVLSPDEYFELSPFLFWTIVFTGSRHYSRDPTLLGKLAPRINSIALRSLESRANPIQTIQGLLLLCVWPVPINTMHKDISNVLSGAAIHLAMQIGLHVIGSGQDFARTKLDSGHDQKVFRAQLWVHCLMISHRTSLREGLPPMIMMNMLSVAPEDDRLLSTFPEAMQIRCKMHNIMLASTTAILKAIQEVTANTRPNFLSHLINLFDAQYLDVFKQFSTGIDYLHGWSYRLHLLAYYFFEHPNSPNHAGMMHLFSVACSFIETATVEDEKTQITEICPVFLERTISLAAFTILKISRSSLSQFVDLEAGEKAYYAAILLCRRASLQSDDISARAVTIMTQLWNSKNIFTQADGQIQSLGTRIRSRLSISIVFDCFWWWREEFAGQPSPYREGSTDGAERIQTTLSNTGESMDGVLQQHQQPPPPADGHPYNWPDPFNDMLMLSGDPFPDFEWAANFDFTSLNWTPNTFNGQ